jgi:hypothetical protein
MNKATYDPARRRAQYNRERSEQQRVDTRRSVQRAEAAKTARLRELRLAKGAADKEERQRAERLDNQYRTGLIRR